MDRCKKNGKVNTKRKKGDWMKITHSNLPLRTRVLILLAIYFCAGALFGTVPVKELWVGIATIIAVYVVLICTLISFFPEIKKK